MKIEVYGSGCANCLKTIEMIKQVVEEKGIQAEVVKVSDIEAMLDKGILKTPAVYIDDRKIIEGKVPTKEEIKLWF